MQGKKLKAILFVVTGAVSFGLISTLIKLAQRDGHTVPAIIFSQVLTGFIVLLLLNLFFSKRDTAVWNFTGAEKTKVILHGCCVGLINICYVLSIRYGTAATSIVLMAQSVWMSILLERFFSRRLPSRSKVATILLILGGTVLVTNLWNGPTAIRPAAIGFGLLSAVANTASIYFSSHWVTHKAPLRRTFYLSLGCLILVSLFSGRSLLLQFDSSILYTWGILLGLTGTVITPLMYIRGMPVIGVGLSSIITSLQIPAAAVFACLLLGEAVSAGQWLGIILITGAIIRMNMVSRVKE